MAVPMPTPKTSIGVVDTQPVALATSVLVLLQSVTAVLAITHVWEPSPVELGAWISVYTSFVIVVNAIVHDKVWSQRSMRSALSEEQAKTAAVTVERDALMAKLAAVPTQPTHAPVVPLFPLGTNVIPRPHITPPTVR